MYLLCGYSDFMPYIALKRICWIYNMPMKADKIILLTISRRERWSCAQCVSDLLLLS